MFECVQITCLRAIEPSNPYSDTDHTPLVSREAVEGVSRFSNPPAPTFSVVEDLIDLNDGTGIITAFGTITPGAFGFPQTLRVMWKAPGGIYENLKDVKPVDNKATFRTPQLSTGTHYFEVFAISEFGFASTGVEHSIVINDADFTINGKIIENAADRTFTAIGGDNRYRGDDTAVVPLSVITASVIKSSVIDNGLNVDMNIAGEVINAQVLQSSQGDSIFQAKVEGYNKFNERFKLVTDPTKDAFLVDGFSGAGTLGKGTIARKDCDPLEEAIFKITIRNRHGWSLPKFLNKGNLSDTLPTVLSRANVVTDLVGSPTSSSSVRFSGSFTFGSNTLKLQKRNVGQGVADWADHATGITSLPYDAVGLPENSQLEYRMVSSANAAYVSNIIRVTTYAQTQAAPTYPAPISLSGAPDAGAPTTKLNFSFIAKGNVATQVWVNGSNVGSDVAAVAVDASGSFSRTSLTPGTSYSVKVRHDYGSGHYSDFSNEVTVATEATPPSETNPTIDSVSYNTGTQQVSVPFTPGSGGSGNYTVAVSATEFGTYTNLTTSLAASPFTETVNQTGSTQSRFYKVKRSAGFSAPVQLVIPANEPAHIPTLNIVTIDNETGLFDLYWTNHGGTGYNQIMLRFLGDPSAEWQYYDSAPPTATHHQSDISYSMTGSGNYEVYLKNEAGESNHKTFSYTAPSGGGGGGGGV